MRKPFEWSLVVVLVALVSWGCDGGMYMKKCIPTKGVLMVNGKPGAGVTVWAHAVQKDDVHPTVPMGVTNDQGEFNFQTYDPKDGCPEGEYRLGFVKSGGEGGDAWHSKYNPPANDAKVYKISGKSVDLGTIELKTK